MSCLGTAVIIVMVLPNSMDLLKGEVGSSSETCVSSGLDVNEITGVVNEQCTYKFELGNQPRTDTTSFQMLTRAVYYTYKYVQLRH